MRSDARAISLIKVRSSLPLPFHSILTVVATQGVKVTSTTIQIFADVIQSTLSIPCSALSGANIADEVAAGQFSESTIGCRDLEEGEVWARMLETEGFRIQLTEDVRGVSLAGALKNGSSFVSLSFIPFSSPHNYPSRDCATLTLL